MSKASNFGGVVMPAYQGVRGSVHRLTQDWSVEVAIEDGRVFRIEVRKGFLFDGASVPRLFWRVCGHPLEVPRVAAAVAHDWIYRSHVLDRETADAIFRAICLKVGLSSFRVAVEYRALRWFGWSAWNEAKRTEKVKLQGLVKVLAPRYEEREAA